MKLLNQIDKLVKEDKFQHYFLYQHIQRTYDEDHEISSKWLKQDDDGWILGFCANYNYNIYGQNYSEKLFNSVKNELDFTKLPDKICFSGDKELIAGIIEANENTSFEIYKERYFYEINADQFIPFENGNVTIRLANQRDLTILTELTCKFFEEEYKGKNNKSIIETRLQMQSSIDNDKIIVVEQANKVCGYCSRMDTMFGGEMIGTVFVDRHYRNRDYGKSLVSSMTKTILSNNKKCWLMTDVTNNASNHIITALGYKKIFHYTSGEMTKN